MKPYYALLAVALLAACTPADVSTAPSSGATGGQRVLETIPAKFHGTWTYKQDGRHPSGGENPTVIGANAADFTTGTEGSQLELVVARATGVVQFDDVSLALVPEPSSAALLGLGGLALLARRRK